MAEARNLPEYEEKPKIISVVKPSTTPTQKAPKTKKKKIYYWLTAIGALLVTFICIISLISIQNEITDISQNIVTIEQKNNDVDEEIKEMTQEENELSRVDRVMKIAKEEGLSVDDNNIRKVIPNEK
ncbi:cell division protein FtsL [Catellicoccus marimammalium]|uniref:Cell division protein FtsL n=1 Tax=Catellicoccus marimammalium M35/04/3 TaxID=1234409 RepID=K8ZP55_9ENTE|nr:cell division protein FtsL [Catellicoccus marimammalium]EKU27366.1 hypothetical protein C683_0697 [Catellicoccus marimammalium M35/04/3]